MVTKDNIDNKKKALLEALEENMGIVSAACKKLKISRQSHYNWLKEDEDYRNKVDELQNFCLDFVESKLFKRIKDEDTTSIIFYLKTKGRSRGYAQDVAAESKTPVVPTRWIDDEDIKLK